MAYWALQSGAMKTISVGNSSHIWAFDAEGTIFKKNTKAPSSTTDSAWIKVSPLPDGEVICDISVGEFGQVIACSQKGKIFRRDMEDEKWHSFSKGDLSKVSVANNSNITGISMATKTNKKGQTIHSGYLYGFEEEFIKLENTEDLIDIAIGSDGQIFVIGADSNKVYRYLYPIDRSKDSPNTTFRMIDGNFPGAISISLANETLLLAIGTDNEIYRYVGENLWEKIIFQDRHTNLIHGELKSISTGADGHIMVVLMDRFEKTYKNYTYIPTR